MNSNCCDTLKIRVADHRLRSNVLRYRLLLTPRHEVVQGHDPTCTLNCGVGLWSGSAHVCSGEETTWILRHPENRAEEMYPTTILEFNFCLFILH
jgi:hypothetical protein